MIVAVPGLIGVFVLHRILVYVLRCDAHDKRQPAVNTNADAGFGHGTDSAANGRTGGVIDGDVELVIAGGVGVGFVLGQHQPGRRRRSLKRVL